MGVLFFLLATKKVSNSERHGWLKMVSMNSERRSKWALGSGGTSSCRFLKFVRQYYSMKLKFKSKSGFLAIHFSPDGSGTLPVLDPLVVELFQLLLALLQVSDRLPRVLALLVPDPLDKVESSMLKIKANV